MSPNVTGLMLLLTLWTAPLAPAPGGCETAATAALDDAGTAALAGEFISAEARLRTAMTTTTTPCQELVVAAWAWNGWQAARRASELGGTDESMQGVRAALRALGPPAGTASAAGYATAVLQAAAAAAQDERDEMQVWLEHARGLAGKLALAGEPARWPLPIDVVDGELWTDVDDYEQAEASFARALAARDSAVAWRGLARARDRRGNRDGACAAYRRAVDVATVAAPKGLVATEARGYLLICER